MSAEVLREAAAAIRKDQDIEENLGHIYPQTYETWLAVADWLDRVARSVVGTSKGDVPFEDEALAVARAYLGRSS